MSSFSISALREAISTPGLVYGSDSIRHVQNLRVPVPSKPYLNGEILDEEFNQPPSFKWQNGATFPGALGSPFNAQTHSITEISTETDIRKPKFEVQFSFPADEPSVQHFEAGDAFYVICPNSDIDVEFLLARLDLAPKANLKYRLTKIDGAEKNIPDYVPPSCSIRYILTYCLDIRRSPGRPVIRALADYCSSADERRRMLELFSIEGSKEFNQHVQLASISLIDFMIHFESCVPPVDRLIEILPRLLPRAYTVSSWDLFRQNRLRFIISLMKTKAGNGVVYTRYGLCSGYLKSILNGDRVQLIAKEPSKFRFPLSVKPDRTLNNTSVIMVGPGTGVAPFMAFLERFREIQRSSGGETPADVKRFLLYGSSNLEKEYIFKEEIEELKKEGIITDLILCESQPTSQDSARPKYIYEALQQLPAEFWDQVFSEPQPFIYACGDVKLMSKQLWECLTNIIAQRKGISKPEAVTFLKHLREHEYFIEDVWS